MNHLSDRVEAGPVVGSLVSGSVARGRLIASRHVYDEMYKSDNLGNRNKFEKLARQAADRGLQRSPNDYRTVFEDEYLPRIRFVEIDDLYQDDPRAQKVAAIDVKDAPTGQVVALLDGVASIVYSHDKSLTKAGLAPVDLGLVLAAWNELDLANATLAGVGHVAIGVSIGLDHGTKALAGVLKVPQWVVVAIAGGLVVWALSDPVRRKKALRVAGPIGDHLLEVAQRGTTAEAELTRAAVSIAPDLDLVQSLAELLIGSPDGHGLSDIEILGQLCQRSDTAEQPVAEDVRQVLDARSCFVKDGQGCWHLGETLAPMEP